MSDAGYPSHERAPSLAVGAVCTSAMPPLWCPPSDGVISTTKGMCLLSVEAGPGKSEPRLIVCQGGRGCVLLLVPLFALHSYYIKQRQFPRELGAQTIPGAAASLLCPAFPDLVFTCTYVCKWLSGVKGRSPPCRLGPACWWG